MVSEDSPSNSNSSILHQFILSNSMPDQGHIFNPYGADSVTNSLYPHSFPLNNIQIPRSVDHLVPDESEINVDIGRDRRLMDLLGTTSNQAPPHPHQRLSLSLASVPSRQSGLVNNPSYLIPGESARESFNVGPDNVINDYFASFWNPNSAATAESFAAAIGGSKYLKPVQSLLQEMVNVGGKDIDATNEKYVEKLSRRKGSHRLACELKAEISNTELLSEKHSTYVNLLKLLSLLEEVERRYDEYYHHMEELVASFEMIAGLGAGKSYTALALQAMSKHFSTLRKAIASQIRATKHKIEKDTPKISSRMSQLSLMDQEARQTRISLQQLGFLHTSRQTWRPIRGLPETSVTILRAWLFEHFLHPYPNESEKLMLASQTGLSKNQVSNWFINARVRLWKPMIEEMYKEEFGESSTESSTREGVGDSADELI